MTCRQPVVGSQSFRPCRFGLRYLAVLEISNAQEILRGRKIGIILDGSLQFGHAPGVLSLDEERSPLKDARLDVFVVDLQKLIQKDQGLIGRFLIEIKKRQTTLCRGVRSVGLDDVLVNSNTFVDCARVGVELSEKCFVCAVLWLNFN